MPGGVPAGVSAEGQAAARSSGGAVLLHLKLWRLGLGTLGGGEEDGERERRGYGICI
jgi:hypothetical protein